MLHPCHLLPFLKETLTEATCTCTCTHKIIKAQYTPPYTVALAVNDHQTYTL